MKKVPKRNARPSVVPNLAFLSICACGNTMFSGPSACLECRIPRFSYTKIKKGK